ncbi:hypothetical protein B0H34DRAFT_705196, partial [Crassisporium funariophilum]
MCLENLRISLMFNVQPQASIHKPTLQTHPHVQIARLNLYLAFVISLSDLGATIRLHSLLTRMTQEALQPHKVDNLTAECGIPSHPTLPITDFQGNATMLSQTVNDSKERRPHEFLDHAVSQNVHESDERRQRELSYDADSDLSFSSSSKLSPDTSEFCYSELFGSPRSIQRGRAVFPSTSHRTTQGDLSPLVMDLLEAVGQYVLRDAEALTASPALLDVTQLMNLNASLEGRTGVITALAKQIRNLVHSTARDTSEANAVPSYLPPVVDNSHDPCILPSLHAAAQKKNAKDFLLTQSLNIWYKPREEELLGEIIKNVWDPESDPYVETQKVVLIADAWRKNFGPLHRILLPDDDEENGWHGAGPWTVLEDFDRTLPVPSNGIETPTFDPITPPYIQAEPIVTKFYTRSLSTRHNLTTCHLLVLCIFAAMLGFVLSFLLWGY